ncbi:Alpha-amylase precursor [Nonomuraea coxensis DSM 45129]|uniref:Alpha-amylase n=2 Tax=Nonomuraea coxensis TaxID=404386 RepID=A0ABX8TYB2_9ACTN|nr:Alpha-amylase precursor [Nonomuraea coxensis DSM 45129]
MPLNTPSHRLRKLGLASAFLALPLLLPLTPPVPAQAAAHHQAGTAPSALQGMGDREPSDRQLARQRRDLPLSRERFYFAMTDRFANGTPGNDRGGLSGDRLATGFDPTDTGFYQGGDLAGLMARLDYIKGLGTTALWITPAFRNRPVQGTTAGYHGYWITDFTSIDPHLGTNADMKKLVKEAHRRGMKVFFDIITNHTADGIDYKEKQYGYRSKAAYPYVDATGKPFDDGDHTDGSKPFPKVDEGAFPYTPVPVDGVVKKPAWLNDVTMYHNRGDSTFAGESSQHGDFSQLDDLWTERPEVVQGMIDIYRTWVRETDIDGFRIDTAKHVNMEFWERFSPALHGYAAKLGNERFFMFGEVYSSDPSETSRYSTRGGMDATLDFPFQEAARSYGGGTADASRLSRLYAADDSYTDADSDASSLPTFLGNHDMGRIGRFLAQDNPGASDEELLRRDLLTHELMYLTRGQPVVYYGDEQGFTGKGGDRDARQPMFASKAASYLSDDLIGTTSTHATDNYDTGHPLYKGIAALARLRDTHPTLADGAQIERLAQGGVYAFSRIDAGRRVEYVVAVNNAEQPAKAAIPTYTAGMSFTRLYGTGPDVLRADAGRVLTTTVPPLSAVVYKAARPLDAPAARPSIALELPGAEIRGADGDGRVEIKATVPGTGFDRVTFAAKAGSGPWRVLGTDTAPNGRTFRVFHDLTGLRAGTPVIYKAVVEDSAGRLASARASAVVGPEPQAPEPGAARRDWLVVHYARPGGDYDGWDLEVSGDVAQPGAAPLTGQDAFGRFAWIKLRENAANVTLTVRGADGADGAPRTVNPARNGEIWLVQGKQDVHVSRAAAQGFVTIRYNRPDAAYTGWGLHLWGEGLADGAATQWSEPRVPDGTDAFGLYWRVPVRDADVPVNFVIHRGDAKDPGGDQSVTPGRQAEAYVNSGSEQVHPSEAAARNTMVLHYRRPGGDYDGWGLHLWGDVRQPTEWSAPLRPARYDAFGAVFEVPLTEGGKNVSYILHKGDEKDLPDNQSLDVATTGHEVWRLAASPGDVLPQPPARVADVDLDKAEAHWIDRSTIAWNVRPGSARQYTLAFAPDGIGHDKGELTGDYRIIRLVPGALTDEQRAAWPEWASYAALRVDPRDEDLIDQARRGQVVAVERDAQGALLTARGVSLAG